MQFLEASDSSFDFPPLEELDLAVAQEYLALGGEARVNLLLLLQSLQLLLLRLSRLGRQTLSEHALDGSNLIFEGNGGLGLGLGLLGDAERLGVGSTRCAHAPLAVSTVSHGSLSSLESISLFLF